MSTSIDQLTPLDASVTKPLTDCKRVRWLGSDGGYRLGYRIQEVTKHLDLIYDEQRREVVTIAAGNWSEDPQKDINGNPRGAGK